MVRIGLQLHTVRGLCDDFPTLLQRVADHGYRGVEFAHEIHDADTSAVASALGDTGLVPIAGHVSLSHMESEFESLVEQYQSIGCSTLVVPHIDAKRLLSISRIDALAVRLCDLADRLAARGFDLVVHNTRSMHKPVIGRRGLDRLIEADFVPRGGWQHVATGMNHVLPGRFRGLTGFEYLLKVTEAADIGFEIDVEHAVSTGCDPHRLFASVGDRLFAVHISDGFRLRRFPPVHRSTPLGHGDVDIERDVRGAIQHDAEWLIGEVDEHPEPNRASESIIQTIEDSHPSLGHPPHEKCTD